MCSASGRHWKHVTAVVIFLYIQNNLNDPHFSWCVGFTYCPLLIKKKKKSQHIFFSNPSKKISFLRENFPSSPASVWLFQKMPRFFLCLVSTYLGIPPVLSLHATFRNSASFKEATASVNKRLDSIRTFAN